MAILTKHAKHRSKERMGLNKEASDKAAQKALEVGIRHSETAGSLHRYLSRLFLTKKTANNIRIYAEKVFIFSGNVLITVLQLPNEYKKVVNKINKQQKRIEHIRELVLNTYRAR